MFLFYLFRKIDLNYYIINYDKHNMTEICFFEKKFVVFELMRYIDVTNLLNTTKLLKNVKKKFIYRKLNKEYSLEYYNHEEFRSIVNNSVEKSNKQISLDLKYCHNITDVSALGNVHTLYLRYCNNITDLSALGKVHTLDLNNCEKIKDLSALGKVHTLDLSDCENITDVSALGKVNTLNLSHCQNITDVSALGKVHTLDLSGCKKITDVNVLGKVHKLDLSHCEITDVSALGNLKKVYTNSTIYKNEKNYGISITKNICLSILNNEKDIKYFCLLYDDIFIKDNFIDFSIDLLEKYDIPMLTNFNKGLPYFENQFDNKILINSKFFLGNILIFSKKYFDKFILNFGIFILLLLLLLLLLRVIHKTFD
jgi:hypothetical protein